MRPEVRFGKGIGVKAPPVDFDTEEFFETNVAEPYLRPEMIEQGKLAGFIGSFEGDKAETELLGEPVCQARAEVSRVVEEPDALGALACFDHQLARTGIQPSAALLNQQSGGVGVERAAVLLSELELYLQSSPLR